MRKRVLGIVGALSLFALTPATLVAAAPGPTGDQGLIGAKNMTNTNALPHMQDAMSLHTNQNGDLGMVCAVKITNGKLAPGDCTVGGGQG